MMSNKHAMYAVIALAGVGIAIVSGVPAFYLLILACPVMMLFMMSSMTGGMNHGREAASSDDKAAESGTGHETRR